MPTPVDDESFLRFPADFYVFWNYGKSILLPLRVILTADTLSPKLVENLCAITEGILTSQGFWNLFLEIASLLLLYICKHTMTIRGDSESLCQSAFDAKGEYVLRQSFD